MPEVLNVVGHAVPRLDGYDKSTGARRFLSDLTFPFQGDLWARLVRSPHPKATMVDLRVGGPGVVAVFTPEAVPDVAFNPALAPDSEQLRARSDRTLLTRTPRHVGDGVAMVVAETEATAEEAVRNAVVDWRPSDPVLDIDAALTHGCVLGRVRFGDDDVDGVLASCPVVVEETFDIAGAQHVCLETHCCRAEPAVGGVTVWSNTQSPAELRRLVALVLGTGPERVRVRKVDEGGGFGCRQEMYDEALVAWAATRLGRPVRLTYTRAEEFLATRRQHAVRATIRLGLGDDGIVKAIDITAVLDSGAYASHLPYVAGAMAAGSKEAYPRASCRFRARIVRTNTMPGGAYRGYGVAQLNFVIETALDIAARRAGVDPVTLRRRNASPRLERCIDACRRKARSSPANGGGPGRMRRGTGMAVAAKSTVVATESAFSTASVVPDPDGAATLVTGTCDSGTGSSTVLAQVVAEELGIPVSKVRVVEGDTGRGCVDTGSAAQRSVYLGAGAARDAARVARERPGEPLTFQSGPVPASHCACLVTVAVDESLGTVQVERCVLAVDCGRVLNPLGAQGQVQGGAVQGLGLALIDKWSPDGSATIAQHGVPTALDVPLVEVVFVGEPIAGAPYGALGLGELPIVPVPAAVANAVADATGCTVTSLPLRPDVVWHALQDHRVRT